MAQLGSEDVLSVFKTSNKTKSTFTPYLQSRDGIGIGPNPLSSVMPVHIALVRYVIWGCH